jgi:hypothetical protein
MTGGEALDTIALGLNSGYLTLGYSLINSMDAYASFAETLYCSLCFSRSKNTPNATLLPSPRRRKESLRCPASTTSAADPL